MNCPKCDKPGVTEHAEEVDIGVGIQKHVWGYECEDCGQISVLTCCGVLDFQEHHGFCGVPGQ